MGNDITTIPQLSEQVSKQITGLADLIISNQKENNRKFEDLTELMLNGFDRVYKDMDGRFESFGKRFDNKIDTLETKMNARFDKLERFCFFCNNTWRTIAH